MSEQHDAGREARVLLDLRRYEEAAAAARRVLAVEPDNAAAGRLLAAALIDGGHAADGGEVVRGLLTRTPDSAELERLAGVAEYEQGRYEVAERHLQRSLSLDPTSASTHVWLAESLLKRARSLPPRTIRGSAIIGQARWHAEQCARLRPDSELGPVMLSKVALAERCWDDADRHVRRALAVNPENAVAHQVLGLAAAGRGDTSAAADHLVTAGRLNPRSDLALRQLRKLRELRTGLPIGAFGLLLLVRVVGKATGSAVGPTLAAAVVAVLVMGALVWPRWNARRKMSPEARGVLARDRRLRRSRIDGS